jgi:hypothetical protein
MHESLSLKQIQCGKAIWLISKENQNQTAQDRSGQT